MKPENAVSLKFFMIMYKLAYKCAFTEGTKSKALISPLSNVKGIGNKG